MKCEKWEKKCFIFDQFIKPWDIKNQAKTQEDEETFSPYEIFGSLISGRRSSDVVNILQSDIDKKWEIPAKQRG